MVPLERKEGAKHRVASFISVRMSVRSYMKNLNTHWAYASLREKRATIRKANHLLDGDALAEGLLYYSEKREKYIEDIKSVMRVNRRFMGELQVY